MANIVICADGTWNRPEEDLEADFPTNVLRLARAVKPISGDTKQHVFYDWGLGSHHDKLLGVVSAEAFTKIFWMAIAISFKTTRRGTNFTYSDSAGAPIPFAPCAA